MPVPELELFQHIQELFETASSSRNGFYFENLISMIFFSETPLHNLFLVFPSIILSGLIF